ncbi:major type 1 subunit fimbrin (pilin) [Pseudomonas gessardii]|uniref:Fimbrial protein n=1 Tax=Pseudomonas gessardii TaxID=78544 RepID=A0A7Y1MPQ2_9PSED|nr:MULTISPECIES: fimbrial protein [Pseudomonas]MCF4980927.1 fimbrial protein [Pseudomonas gessardii]MCF4991878.1 fimbrial protein [Pseudomonas gessardii]MCF5083931.1 fimbrial protein [Pseudomonas gessardii]MCF5095782.1 fimbrial protein [Pseudomonas gessardii]MCF5110141.1 fimbrial protein [Pseudomonas gessardii]
MNTSNSLIASIFAVSAMASQFASATPTTGTITFTGALVADTCLIGGGSNDLSVSLPSVQTTSLAAAGQTAGDTPFSIVLSGCSPSVPVRAFFSSASSGIDGATGRLKNTGLATNVQVQLLNSASAPIALNNATAAAQGDTLKTTNATGAATLTYTARYFASDATGAGSVNSSVMYEIVYN